MKASTGEDRAHLAAADGDENQIEYSIGYRSVAYRLGRCVRMALERRLRAFGALCLRSLQSWPSSDWRLAFLRLGSFPLRRATRVDPIRSLHYE
jgi:hypothetical protein